MAATKVVILVAAALCCCYVTVLSSDPQSGIDPVRDRARLDKDDKEMHPKKTYDPPRAGPANPGLDRATLRRLDDDEAMMHPKINSRTSSARGSSARVAADPIPSREMLRILEPDDAEMHSRKIFAPSLPGTRKVAHQSDRNRFVPDRETLRRLELDDDVMHPRRDFSPRSSSSRHQEPRRRPAENDDALMHPRKTFKSPRAGHGAPVPDREAIRRIDETEAIMHPRAQPAPNFRPARAAPSRGQKRMRPLELDDDMMHPKVASFQRSRQVAREESPPVPDRASMRQTDDDETRMHPRPQSPKSAPKRIRQRPMEIDDALLHPRVSSNQPQAPPVRDSPQNVQVPGRDALRQLDEKEISMHPRPKTDEEIASARKRPMEMDEAVMHPKRDSSQPLQGNPGQHSQSRPARKVEEKSNEPQLREMTEAEMHPRLGYKLPEEIIPEGEKEVDIEEVLGADFLTRYDIDDSMLHDPPSERKVKRSHSLTKSTDTQPARKLSPDQMHPYLSPGEKLPDEIIPDHEKEVDIEEAIGPDFLTRYDIDDSVLHDPPSERKVKRSYSLTKSADTQPARKLGPDQMHPYMSPGEKLPDEIIPKDEEEVNIVAALGPDFLTRYDIDDSVLHDPPSERRVQPSYYPERRSRDVQMVRSRRSIGAGPIIMEKGVSSGVESPFNMMIEPKLMMKNPVHASCKIDWNFDIPCSDVSTALVSQMKAWHGKDCGSGEKCLYELKFDNSTRIEGTHTTPVKAYVDDISFDLDMVSTGGCKVHGFSTSETWYAYLDYGTNYCNLHNLITGSGLDKKPGYKEMTSDNVCTQYTSADCEKY